MQVFTDYTAHIAVNADTQLDLHTNKHTHTHTQKHTHTNFSYQK
jgi:hypothetical protein